MVLKNYMINKINVFMNEQTIFLCNLIFVCILFVSFLVLLVMYGIDFIYIMILLLTIWAALYACCCDMSHKIKQHAYINQKPLKEKKETIHAEAKIKEIELIEIHTEKNSRKKIIVI